MKETINRWVNDFTVSSNQIKKIRMYAFYGKGSLDKWRDHCCVAQIGLLSIKHHKYEIFSLPFGTSS